MKIAIIGGNRFIGKKVVETLIDNKHDITIFNRSKSGHSKAKVIKFDRDEDKIDLKKFDCIIDMCLYTLKQFKLIKKYIPKKKHYIFISTGAIKYKKAFGPYAIEKEKIEKALAKTNLNYDIVRPSYVVGYGNHIPRLDYFVTFLSEGREIALPDGKGDYPINLVLVNDVAAAINRIISFKGKRENTLYNVCGSKSTTINEIIDIIKEELDIKEHKTVDSLASVFMNQVFEMDNTDTKKLLNMRFTSIKSIIKVFLKEWRESKVS